MLDKRQAEQLFALSHELAEGELHDFDWLPCSITGRVETDGRTWDFKINAAGTSLWHSGNQSRMLGCKHAACEPLVIMTPQSAQD